MAYVTTTRAGQNGLADRAAQIVKSISTMLGRRRLYLQTVRELNALSDRDLADLGIHKAMIRNVAREAAYGK